jgi:hypothetical protein
MSISVTAGTTKYMTRTPHIFIADIGRTPSIFIAGLIAIVLAAGAIAIAQSVGGDSGGGVSDARSDRAERAALQVVEGGRVVSVAHDSQGMAAWTVKVFKPGPVLESFGERTSNSGRHVTVYLDRDYNWLQAKVQGYGPAPQK